ncbi:NIPA-like protein 2 [Liparis tanakae]|uniref:NIPA-like protein 2 n=1 Tax=Liparis tanakae TaxID=230148 RepID=A0A4Z2FP54_9TELE|nr:NIPA-like protein 2 [Liparis tanakae]
MASGSLSSRNLIIEPKYAHVRQSQRGSKPYYTSVVWWCGVALMGVGELGNFAAYGFAPASLIAPLGCVAVIGRSHTDRVQPEADGQTYGSLASRLMCNSRTPEDDDS